MLGAILGVGASSRLPPRLASIEDIVVEALGDEDQIGEAEVYSESDNGGHETSPDGAGEVGDIAYKPDNEEGERDALCGSLSVILDKLWYLGKMLANPGEWYLVDMVEHIICTSRKIHEAREMEPKTPLNASRDVKVKGGPWASRAEKSGIDVSGGESAMSDGQEWRLKEKDGNAIRFTVTTVE